MHILSQLQNSNWFTKKNQLMLTVTSDKPFVYKLRSIHPKQNQKQIIHESNKLCMLQTETKGSYIF